MRAGRPTHKFGSKLFLNQASICAPLSPILGGSFMASNSFNSQSQRQRKIALMCSKNLPNRFSGRYAAPKSRLAAGLLGIFFGELGLHRFYLGYVGVGLAQLLVSALLCWTLVVPLVIWIWGFIEGIAILTGGWKRDRHGNPIL